MNITLISQGVDIERVIKRMEMLLGMGMMIYSGSYFPYIYMYNMHYYRRFSWEMISVLLIIIFRFNIGRCFICYDCYPVKLYSVTQFQFSTSYATYNENVNKKCEQNVTLSVDLAPCRLTLTLSRLYLM